MNGKVSENEYVTVVEVWTLMIMREVARLGQGVKLHLRLNPRWGRGVLAGAARIYFDPQTG